MITVKQKGNFKKLTGYLEKAKEKLNLGALDKYGREGVALLMANTPKDTGLTSKSWYYTIVRENNTVSLQFHNDNIQNGVHIAVILQYGHATRNGGWVEGIDYINPSIGPIFEKIAKQAWEEVKTA